MDCPSSRQAGRQIAERLEHGTLSKDDSLENEHCMTSKKPMLGLEIIQLPIFKERKIIFAAGIRNQDRQGSVFPVMNDGAIACNPGKRGCGASYQTINHFTDGIPRSLQILRARLSSISLWRGTAERRFCAELSHQECRPPSRRSSHPLVRRCFVSTLRFIERYALLHTHRLPPLWLRAC